MKKHRNVLLALGFVALTSLSSGLANAGTLTVVLTVGGDTITITGTPLATLTTTNGIESLTFNTTALNAALAADGSALSFQAGSGVSTNQPSATQASGATLTSTGQVNVSGAGSTSLTITAFLTDYTTPNGLTGVLSSSASSNFTSTAVGDTTSFESYYNGNNAAGGMSLPSGVSAITSNNTTTNSGTAVPPTGTQTAPISSFSTPFSLTNTITISLTNTGKTGESDQYVGSTLVTAAGVPEPASIIMMLTGMPVPMVVLGMLRRRKAAAKA